MRETFLEHLFRFTKDNGTMRAIKLPFLAIRTNPYCVSRLPFEKSSKAHTSAMNRTTFLALVGLISVYGTDAFLPPEEVSLSPKTWFQRDLQRLEELSLYNSQRRPKPLAFSSGKGLVAGSGNALAVHAGKEALKKGGNAMDACLTTALTGR